MQCQHVVAHALRDSQSYSHEKHKLFKQHQDSKLSGMSNRSKIINSAVALVTFGTGRWVRDCAFILSTAGFFDKGFHSVVCIRKLHKLLAKDKKRSEIRLPIARNLSKS